MTANMIRVRIAEGCTLFGFEYDGKECHVDPYYTREKGHTYLLFCGGEEKTVSSLDAVMGTPFFSGQRLEDIADKINITDW